MANDMAGKTAFEKVTEVRDALVIYAAIAGNNPKAAERLGMMVTMLTEASEEMKMSNDPRDDVAKKAGEDVRNKIAEARERNLARCVVARHSLCAALLAIVKANDEFRRTLPKDWESDPVNEACKDARVILDSVKAIVR